MSWSSLTYLKSKASRDFWPAGLESHESWKAAGLDSPIMPDIGAQAAFEPENGRTAMLSAGGGKISRPRPQSRPDDYRDQPTLRTLGLPQTNTHSQSSKNVDRGSVLNRSLRPGSRSLTRGCPDPCNARSSKMMRFDISAV
jgi:hypothetical protein